ncbi:MAG: hypothetical protein REI64_08625 [Pedobacter sp.]|uniref:hypothetical protein n=1 Tax=Pedobacter sp. TaxID=1411316 RepID=UPI002806FF34|nr:hypothetical protein [Pedobacter sp.]MDQ8004848.1 hypothetical protein [Pedobacter sp.]
MLKNLAIVISTVAQRNGELKINEVKSLDIKINDLSNTIEMDEKNLLLRPKSKITFAAVARS